MRRQRGGTDASALAPVAEQIGALIRAARVRCLDETGLRVGVKTQSLHTGGHRKPSPFTAIAPSVARRRKASKAASSSMTASSPIAIWTALRGAAHALCNAHHLRELKALIALDNEPWATGMRDCLRDACQAVGEAHAEGETALSPAALQTFHARYREALREGLAWHRSLLRPEKTGSKSGRTKRRAEDNLLLRLHRFKDDVLRFPVDFDVPFTNNLAEQPPPLFPSGSRSQSACRESHPGFVRQVLQLSRSFLRPDDRLESVIFPSSLHATQAFGYWLGHKTERPKERRLVSFNTIED